MGFKKDVFKYITNENFKFMFGLYLFIILTLNINFNNYYFTWLQLSLIGWCLFMLGGVHNIIIIQIFNPNLEYEKYNKLKINDYELEKF